MMSTAHDGSSLPAHLKFGMNTLSYLYSNDMKLKDIRSVPLQKLFGTSLCAKNMKFLHNQVNKCV